jgi:hypothetical protein
MRSYRYAPIHESSYPDWYVSTGGRVRKWGRFGIGHNTINRVCSQPRVGL